MEIKINSSYGSHALVYTAENVKVEESVSETIYADKEDGKKDFSKRLGTDIEDGALNKFASIFEDLIYYRQGDFDSSSLISQAFAKLPDDKQKLLLIELNENYGEV